VADNEPGTNVLQAAAVAAPPPAMKNRRVERLSNMRGQFSKKCVENLEHDPDDECQGSAYDQECERNRNRQQQKENGVIHESDNFAHDASHMRRGVDAGSFEVGIVSVADPAGRFVCRYDV
jgi:hypothetical protein